jgi:MFS family permease
MGSLIAIGGALGPFLAGLAYDLTGSYNMFVIVGMVGCFVAGLLILTLPRCPEWKTVPTKRHEEDRVALLEEVP